MASSNALNIRFLANITQFDRELRRLQRLNQQAADQIARQGARAANAWGSSLSRQIGSMSNQIRQFAPILAGAFSVGAVAVEFH